MGLVVETVKGYTEDSGLDVPLILHGEPGTGMSSIVAVCARNAEESWGPNAKPETLAVDAKLKRRPRSTIEGSHR